MYQSRMGPTPEFTRQYRRATKTQTFQNCYDEDICETKFQIYGKYCENLKHICACRLFLFLQPTFRFIFR